MLLTRDKKLTSTVRVARCPGESQFAGFESELESRLHRSHALLVRMDLDIPLQISSASRTPNPDRGT